MSSKTISISEDLKKVLEGIKKDLSENRRVTWNEVVETLVKSYHGKRMTSIENKRLQHTITKIAVNQSKQGIMVTQQTLVPVNQQQLAAPVIPPPLPHFCSPPKPGEKDKIPPHIRELDALNLQYDGNPVKSLVHVLDPQVQRFLENWVFPDLPWW